jgi:hypothetical protein
MIYGLPAGDVLGSAGFPPIQEPLAPPRPRQTVKLRMQIAVSHQSAVNKASASGKRSRRRFHVWRKLFG